MVFFVEVVNGWKLFFAESSILDNWLGSECASDERREQELRFKAWWLITDQFFVLQEKNTKHMSQTFSWYYWICTK